MTFAPNIRMAFFVTLFTLLIGAVAFRGAMGMLGVFLVKEPVPLRRALSTIPSTLGDWKRVGNDRILSAEIVGELGTDIYLDRVYARRGDPAAGMIYLHLAYYTGFIDTVPHIPTRCAAAAGLIPLRAEEVVDLGLTFKSDAPPPPGMSEQGDYAWSTVLNPVTGTPESVALPAQPVQFTLAAFQEPGSSRGEWDFGYSFVANGGITPSSLGVRALAFNLSDKYAYYCKIQISMQNPNSGEAAIESFRADARDFTEQLMRQLMRVLPDWPAIEAQDAAQRAVSAH